MKKVIIALDYDPSAEKVAQSGYEVAKALHAEVILFHAISEPAYYESSTYSPIMGFVGFSTPEIFETGKGLYNEAKRFLEESKKHLGDETVDICVMEGDLTEALKTAIEKFDASMLVMGTHSRRGLDKLLMGNLAEKMMHHINIPLLSIPTHT